MAPHDLSFCRPPCSSLRSPFICDPVPSHLLKTEQENETRSGLGLWTIKWPQQLWSKAPRSPTPSNTLDYSHLPRVRLPTVRCDASDQVINTSGAPSSCCYCRAAKFGPRAQSPRLQANQLNQHSLIPASRHSFIKGLDEVSSNFFFFCFLFIFF